MTCTRLGSVSDIVPFPLATFNSPRSSRLLKALPDHSTMTSTETHLGASPRIIVTRSVSEIPHSLSVFRFHIDACSGLRDQHSFVPLLMLFGLHRRRGNPSSRHHYTHSIRCASNSVTIRALTAALWHPSSLPARTFTHFVRSLHQHAARTTNMFLGVVARNIPSLCTARSARKDSLRTSTPCSIGAHLSTQDRLHCIRVESFASRPSSHLSFSPTRSNLQQPKGPRFGLAHNGLHLRATLWTRQRKNRFHLRSPQLCSSHSVSEVGRVLSDRPILESPGATFTPQRSQM